jgi:uncharacterized protein (DUF1015 family)
VTAELAQAELLIADGHHRYETALTYAEEVGGDGPHRYTLMSLTGLDDPGLTVFGTHRLLGGLATDSARQETLAKGIKEHFDLDEVGVDELDPAEEDGVGVFGYIDSHADSGFRLRLKDPASLEPAMPDASEAYRTLDAAILEALILKGTVGMSDDDVAAKRDLAYAKSVDEATKLLDAGTYQAAFLLRPTPIEQVRAVAAAGETMPPKSTYFFPKLLTGLLFNPLS